MEEVIEFLNSKGKIIGKGSRMLAHQKGIWHRVVVGFIVNDNMQVLLQQRSKDKDYPLLWDASATGHVDINEKPIDAICREFKEELGVNISKNKLQHILTDKNKYKSKTRKDYQFLDFYLIKSKIAINDITIQASEIEQVKWIDLKEYINKLKNKNKNYLIHSKNEWKILEAYLIYQNFIKNKNN